MAAVAGRTDQRERVVGPGVRLPSSRAVVGGLLVALATVGVYVALTGAAATPTVQVVVAARDLGPGHVVELADLGVTPIAADDVRSSQFTDVDSVVGATLLGPVGAGEYVQDAVLAESLPPGSAHELTVALARARAVDGRIHEGDVVDVYATWSSDTTELVAAGVTVVHLGSEETGVIGAAGEVVVDLAVPDPRVVPALVHAGAEAAITLVRQSPGAGSAVDQGALFHPPGAP